MITTIFRPRVCSIGFDSDESTRLTALHALQRLAAEAEEIVHDPAETTAITVDMPMAEAVRRAHKFLERQGVVEELAIPALEQA